MWNRETVTNRDEVQKPQTPQTPVTMPAASPVAAARHATAGLGKSVVLKGDVVSAEDMTIDGRVEGTIELREHSLTIGPDAHVRARISAKVVTVLGTVTGSITAHEVINISGTGRVEGDVTATRLVMADGAVLQGRATTGRWSAAAKSRKPELAAAV